MAEYALQASWTCSGCGLSSNIPQQHGTNAQALGQRCVRLAREQGWRIPYGGTGGTFCPRCNGGSGSPSLTGLGWDVHDFVPGYSRMSDQCQANRGACLLPRDHATHTPREATDV